MSDLAATNCGGGCDRCDGGNNCIWLIIILLFCCGGFGGHNDGCGGFGGGHDCGCLIIILLLFCCGGMGNGCGFGFGGCDRC